MSIVAIDQTDSEASVQSDLSVGQDLRALRKSNGFTLSEMALKVGRSVGYISQVERGLSSPSINELRSFAQAFDVPVSWFFIQDEIEDDERGLIVRADNRRKLGTRETGIIEELLSPDLGGSFEMFRSVFAGGGEMTEAVLRETEEAGYIVSGELEMWIGDRHFHLLPGDSFKIENQPYRWKNPNDTETVVLWVVSPPVY